jgi:DNA polymerase I-like protein with 3'-5' exonuclease and polymerase domains
VKTYAIDFETYYDEECSIKTLGPRGYFSHPSFDAYMLTVVGDDGFVYAGHPKNFDWQMLAGQTVLAHNASFDESLYLYGVEAGWYPKVEFGAFHCTADMCAALGKPRSLKNATAEVFGLKITKTTRDNMKGKQWSSMPDDFRKEVTEYAIKDSELCLRLWQELSDGWPEFERKISSTNRRIGQRGLPIDEGLLHRNLGVIKKALYDAEQSIPWIKEYTPLSRKAFNEQCRKEGITPPKSLAQDSDEADAWFAAHQQACPWARAVQSFRRINAFMRKLESFDAGTMPDGRYYGGLMYFGANPTGRFSGSGGNLNLQNLPRGEMFGVNFRRMIRPKEGYKLIAVDLSQIEVRTLCWWAEDTVALEEIRKSPDIYHAFGVLLGLHDPANGPLKDYSSDLRAQVKMLTLGCGFMLGPKGFASKEGIPLDEAERSVGLYRSKMKKIVRFWNDLKTDCEMAYTLGQTLTVELPSGRVMDYGKLKRMRNKNGYFDYIGQMVRNGAKRDFKLWAGLQAENCLSGDTEVLTQDGWKAMLEITTGDLLWDGIEWVGHDGLIHNGIKEVIDCHGVICTPDHLFLNHGKWVPAAQLACTDNLGMVSLPNGREQSEEGEAQRQGYSGNALRVIGSNGVRGEHREETIMGSAVRLRIDRNETRGGYKAGEAQHDVLLEEMPFTPRASIQQSTNSRQVIPQVVRGLACDERPVPSPVASGLEKLRRSGNYCLQSVAGIISELLGRHGPLLDCGFNSGPDRQFFGLQSGELPMGYMDPASSEHSKVQNPKSYSRHGSGERHQEVDAGLPDKGGVALGASRLRSGELPQPVYDIRNCGPRNRFTVRGTQGQILIAHNCAQALARDVFSDMLVRVDEAGYKVILHVHDELVVEVPEAEADSALKEILSIMSTPPEWIPDIPVSAEGKILDFYSK